MEVPLPHPRNAEVLHETGEGEEIAGVVGVGLGGVLLQAQPPFFPHERREKSFDHGLDPLFHFLRDLFTGFVRYRGLPSFTFLVFPGRLRCSPADTLLGALPPGGGVRYKLGMAQASVVVLAGGNGQRLGLDKALLCRDGRPLLPGLVQALGQQFPEVLVAVGRRRAFPFPIGAVEVEDLLPGGGPLSGIHAGLAAASHPVVFFVACDMPFPSGELLALLSLAAGPAQAAVCRIHGHLEPFPGAYPRAFLPQVERALRDGLGVQAFLARVPHVAVPEEEARRVDPELRSFVNLNTWEDVRRWL